MRRASGKRGMRRAAVKLAIVAAIGFLVSGCGSSSNTGPVTITSILPASVPAGDDSFLLSATGTGLQSTSFVFVGGQKLTPVQVIRQTCSTPPCPLTLTVSVQASQVAAAGKVVVQAQTDNVNSNAVDLAVVSPQLLTMSPLAATAGGGDFRLSLTMLNAAPQVSVTFDKTTVTPTGPVNCNAATACRIDVVVPAAAIASAGTVTVTAANSLATSGGTAATSFVITPAVTAPVLQSVNGSSSSGTAGNAASTHSSASDGGLFVAFDSTATNLVGGATSGLSQVYLRQNCPGAASGCTAQTTLISAASGGAPGAGGVNGSDRPAISADGRYVVFESDDTNLVSGVSSPVEQIYLTDTCNSIFGAVKSCTPTTTLISQDGSGTPGNAPSGNPSISAFGLYIAYESQATNLTSATVPASTDQIYLELTCNAISGAVSGCQPATQLVSTNTNGGAGDNNSINPSLDPLGYSLAFSSLADNLVAGLAGNGFQQIYLHTTCLAAPSGPLAAGCAQQTLLISGDAGERPGTADSVTPAVGGGGGYVVYATSATNLLPANAAGQQIVGSNVCLNVPATTQCVPSGNVLLSATSGGLPGAGNSSNPAVNGSLVAFTSLANLVSGASGQQVYGVNVCLPPLGACALNPAVISVDGSGNAIGGDFAAVGGGRAATFSTTGSAVNLGVPEIFLANPSSSSAPGAVARRKSAKQ